MCLCHTCDAFIPKYILFMKSPCCFTCMPFLSVCVHRVSSFSVISATTPACLSLPPFFTVLYVLYCTKWGPTTTRMSLHQSLVTQPPTTESRRRCFPPSQSARTGSNVQESPPPPVVGPTRLARPAPSLPSRPTKIAVSGQRGTQPDIERTGNSDHSNLIPTSIQTSISGVHYH